MLLWLCIVTGREQTRGEHQNLHSDQFADCGHRKLILLEAKLT